MFDEEMVSVLIPKRCYPQVMQVVTDSLKATTEADVERVRGWSASEIAKLRSVLKNKTVIMLLDMTAGMPGQWVTFGELCQEAGRTKRQAMGDLAGFTQLIMHQFGKVGHSLDVWPIEVVWNEKGSPKYRMPDEIARGWKEAASPQ